MNLARRKGPRKDLPGRVSGQLVGYPNAIPDDWSPLIALATPSTVACGRAPALGSRERTDGGSSSVLHRSSAHDPSLDAAELLVTQCG